MLPTLLEVGTPNLDVIRDDIALMLPNAALQISERAVKQTELKGMKEQLAKAQDAKTVIDDASFIPTSKRKSPTVASVYDKFNNNILSVQGLIQKENDYAKALLDIASLTDQSKTDEAFGLYQQLTRQYGELATRDELQVAMKAVSTKERGLVKPVQVDIPIATTRAVGSRQYCVGFEKRIETGRQSRSHHADPGRRRLVRN